LNFLGLIKPRTVDECFWFCETFGGEPVPLPSDDDDHRADLRVEEGQPAEDVITFYNCARAHTVCAGITAGCELDDVRVSGYACEVLLHRIPVHMIE